MFLLSLGMVDPTTTARPKTLISVFPCEHSVRLRVAFTQSRHALRISFAPWRPIKRRMCRTQKQTCWTYLKILALGAPSFLSVPPFLISQQSPWRRNAQVA